MIQPILNFVAGVDRKTLASCPATDKMWAAHLGFSLCLSFVVVFGVTFHATGYMLTGVWVRLLVALVIGLTVLMFDRALCQSDWFYQGTLFKAGGNVQSLAETRQSFWRFGRIAVRLSMSFGLAWVIAMFLELAIFSGTISEKIEADRIAANQPIFQKITQFDSQLGVEADRRRAALAELETMLRNGLGEPQALDPASQARSDDLEQQVKALAARETELRAEQRQIDEQIQRYTVDMNAEELGQKLNPTNSGRPGAGPRYEFAKRQRDDFRAQRAARDGEIAQLHAKRDELRAAQAKVATDSLQLRDQERTAQRGQRDSLQAQIDAARADLKQFETARIASVADFRRKALAESYFQEKKEKVDPLTRMAAYQSLKNDPKDGATIALFSWMTRFFIIFLEIVPVVAKIFFSPPSVYAAKIQAEVERARQRIQDHANEPEPAPPPVPAAPAMPVVARPPRPRRAAAAKPVAPAAAMAAVAAPAIAEPSIMASALAQTSAPAAALLAKRAAEIDLPQPDRTEAAPQPLTETERREQPAIATSSDCVLPAPTLDAQVVPLNREPLRDSRAPERPADASASAPMVPGEVLRFSADVERLMSEAVSHAKPTRPRRPHGAAPQVQPTAEADQLPLNFSLQYEIAPRG